MAKLEDIFEKLASAEDSVTLTKEELAVLQNFAEGFVNGMQKAASAAFAVPMTLDQVYELVKDDEASLRELNDFLGSVSGGDEKVAAEIGSNLVFLVSPAGGIVDVIVP